MVGIFITSPAILNRIFSLKLENFAVKSNSEKRFTFAKKNSERAVKNKKNAANGKNLSFNP